MFYRRVLPWLVLAAFAITPGTALAKKSKKEALAEAKAKVRAKYAEKMGGAVFHDCSHWVDMKALDDTRWAVPEKHQAYKSDLSGIMLIARFNMNTSAGATTVITIICQKWQQTDTSKKYSMSFDNIGENHYLSQVKKCHDGFYRDWTQAAKDVLEDRCVKPRKKRTGPADYFASAVGTDPGTNERVRRDWYMWGKSNETFMITVEYAAAVLGEKELLDRGEDFVKRIRRVKEKVPIIRK